MKEKITKTIFLLLNIAIIIPSIVYLIQNKTVMNLNIFYNFFINLSSSKEISSFIYLTILILLYIFYIIIIKKKILKNIKEILKYTAVIGTIYLIMLPLTSSDVFYYMGVGELDGKYNQNPYYVTMKEYYNENSENINDDILKQGATNYWANTTVVYGPIAQLIFKLCTLISFKNINVCLFVFKILNLIVHLANCYLIYKITNKKVFSGIYGLNPYILVEFIGNVHNDIIVVFFTLLALFFLLKKKSINISIIFLAIATGIKYYTILLLPVIVLYYFRREKIGKKIIKCIQYGFIFVAIFLLEYILYFKDITVFGAMLPQGSRYSKSIYSALMFLIPFDYIIILRWMVSIVFVYLAICFYTKMLIENDNKIIDMIRKYNKILAIFLLTLTNCQQWYLIWLFTTIMWQKSSAIKNIIYVSFVVEIANSVYMFLKELWVFDVYYVAIIIILFIIYKLIYYIKTRGVLKNINSKIS